MTTNKVTDAALDDYERRNAKALEKIRAKGPICYVKGYKEPSPELKAFLERL